MRDITSMMVDAFWAGTQKSRGNSEVTVRYGEVTFYLHGNAIARRPFGLDRLEISASGWATNTTKERLNGILRRVNGSISQRNRVWYLYLPANEVSVEIDTGYGVWTVAHPGSDLEQLALVTKEREWNEGRV